MGNPDDSSPSHQLEGIPEDAMPVEDVLYAYGKQDQDSGVVMSIYDFRRLGVGIEQLHGMARALRSEELLTSINSLEGIRLLPDDGLPIILRHIAGVIQREISQTYRSLYIVDELRIGTPVMVERFDPDKPKVINVIVGVVSIDEKNVYNYPCGYGLVVHPVIWLPEKGTFGFPNQYRTDDDRYQPPLLIVPEAALTKMGELFPIYFSYPVHSKY